MAGGLMVKPAGPSTTLGMGGRVTLTPSEMNAKAAARPSTKLGMSGEEKPKPSKRAHVAMLKARRREDAVLAPQRVVLDRVGFNSYLRNGSF